jgi:hypothetical protein
MVVFEREATSTDTFINEEGAETEQSGFETVYRYIERGSGHIYETTERTLTQTRLSNTTIPKVRNAIFSDGGESILLQYLSDSEENVVSYLAQIVPKATTSPDNFRIISDGYKLEGDYLPINITSIDSDEETLGYFISAPTNGAIVTSNFNDTAKQLIYETETSQWNIQFVDGGFVMTNKADSRINGFSYFLNSTTKVLNKIIGDLPGLSVLSSPSRKWVLYSEGRTNQPTIFALNTETNETKRLDIKTLAEKCIFSKNNEDQIYCAATDNPPNTSYPESWYQGEVSFNDNVWKIDLVDGFYTKILEDQGEIQRSFDVSNLILANDDEYLLFIDKKDLSLWSLDISN